MVLAASTTDDARVVQPVSRGARHDGSRGCDKVFCPGCRSLLLQASCPACELRREEEFRAELARRRNRLNALLAGNVTAENEHLARRVMRLAERV